jgi:hypothetical protein
MSSSDTVKVITNNIPRDVIDAYELTVKEREDFDYLNWQAIDAGEDSASFFRYRGHLYDLNEFTRWDATPHDALRVWDGYRSDSFFSALVVRYVENCERVIVGLVLS